MAHFLRLGSLRLQLPSFDHDGDRGWSDFLTALRTRIMARIAEFKETHADLLPVRSVPEGDEDASAAKGATADEPGSGDPSAPLILVLPNSDPTAEGDGAADFELVFESPNGGSVDLASVFGPSKSPIDLEGLLVHLDLPRLPVIPPDLPG